ncbi:hypothetical protein NW752_001720 [Fusarium irregulare]|uniref:Uncharacterized protein n=1 Tax=Fusarium irregulare TaxID=2494466 RepID=A0A9W8PU80_9HYPO|nr:hypothetical protein NW766_003884 [Fusarium irregulare]KAJ4026766.1 hypothetical protein NW752_001720 [Fusarium irregulare]
MASLRSILEYSFDGWDTTHNTGYLPASRNESLMSLVYWPVPFRKSILFQQRDLDQDNESRLLTEQGEPSSSALVSNTRMELSTGPGATETMQASAEDMSPLRTGRLQGYTGPL